MNRNLLVLLKMARPALGLSLVLAAFAGTAMAGGPPVPGAPEIDPGSIGSALTLLASGAFLFSSKSRKA